MKIVFPSPWRNIEQEFVALNDPLGLRERAHPPQEGGPPAQGLEWAKERARPPQEGGLPAQGLEWAAEFQDLFLSWQTGIASACLFFPGSES